MTRRRLAQRSTRSPPRRRRPPAPGLTSRPDDCLPNRYADVAHGCGLGVEYPFIWYREDAERGAHDGVFEQDMVVCVECYVGRIGGSEGVKLEQPIRLGADGPVALAEYPFELDYL